jgi:hypothetical protein
MERLRTISALVADQLDGLHLRVPEELLPSLNSVGCGELRGELYIGCCCSLRHALEFLSAFVFHVGCDVEVLKMVDGPLQLSVDVQCDGEIRAARSAFYAYGMLTHCTT